jgi:hypothetical protein
MSGSRAVLRAHHIDQSRTRTRHSGKHDGMGNANALSLGCARHNAQLHPLRGCCNDAHASNTGSRCVLLLVGRRLEVNPLLIFLALCARFLVMDPPGFG